MILILPNLIRGPRRRIKWLGDAAPVVCGDWHANLDGTVTSSYDRNELERALGLIRRETGRRINTKAIMTEVFGDWLPAPTRTIGH